MRQPHKYYLSLGSNIEPEANLGAAVELLSAHGVITTASSVWESRAIGSSGPNFLNACVSFIVPAEPAKLKREITTVIETTLGRIRTVDRLAPRTIDIDTLMADDQALNLELWSHAFVVLPMAELLPEFMHPTDHRPLKDLAVEMRAAAWIVPRPARFPPPHHVGDA